VAFKNQFNEKEWLILQAAPIWVFEIEQWLMVELIRKK